MSTGIESWADVSSIGALYPFVGSEMLWVIICIIVWLSFTVWQLRHEKAHYAQVLAELKKDNRLKEAVER